MKKVFLYVLFCVVVSTSATGITLLANSNLISGLTDSQDEDVLDDYIETPQTEQEKAMGAIMSGALDIMTSGNINAKGTLSIKSSSFNRDLDFDAKMKLDLSNVLNSKADITISTGDIRANIIYVDNEIFLDTFNNKFRLNVSTIEELISIFNDVTDMPSDASSGLAFAVDMDKLDSLMQDISYSENSNGESVVGFNLYTASLISGLDLIVPIEIVVGSDGTYKNISINNFKVGEVVIDLEIELNNDDVKITADSDSYKSLDYIPSLVEAGINSFVGRDISLNGEIEAFGQNIKINSLKVDVDNLFVYCSINYLGRDFVITHVNQTTYIELLGKQFKITNQTINDVIDIVSGLIDIDNTEIDTDELINQLSSVDILGTIELIMAQISSINYLKNDNSEVLSFSAYDFEFQLTLANDLFKTLNMTYKDFKVRLNFVNEPQVTINQPQGDFIDFEFLPVLLKTVQNSLDIREVELNGSVSINGFNAFINNAKFDFSNLDNIALSLDANMLGKDIKVTHLDSITYLNAFNSKFRISNDTVLKLVKMFGDIIPTEMLSNMPGISMNDIDMLSTIEGILSNVDNITHEYVNGEHVIMLKAYGGTFVLKTSKDYEIKGVNAEIDDIKVDLNFISVHEDVVIEKPSDYYINLDFLYPFVDSLSDILSSTKLSLSANVSLIGGKNVNDSINFDIDKFLIDFTHLNDIIINGHVSTSGDLVLAGGLSYSNNIIYLDYAGLKVQIGVDTIMELVSMLGIDMSIDTNSLTDGLSFDVDMIESILACLVDAVYVGDTVSLKLNLPKVGDVVLRFEIANGRLSSISGEDINSIIDNGKISFKINILDAGDHVKVEGPKEYYMDFNALPQLVDTFFNTSKLETFDVNGAFDVKKDGQDYITADPRVVVDLANGFNVYGSGYVDFANDSEVDYDLGLWYDQTNIHAKINSMKVKLDVDAIPDIIDGVMMFFDTEFDIVDMIGMVSSFDFNSITKMVKDIETIKNDGKTVIRITIDGNELYNEINLNITNKEDVVIEIEINEDNYFDIVRVSNVMPADGQTMDFSLYLDKIGSSIGTGETDINVESYGDTSSYIDLSGTAPIIQAIKKTSEKDFYEITGAISYPGLGSVGGIVDQTVLLRISKDENGKAKFSLVIASEASSRNWTRVREMSTMFYEDGVMYIRQHNAWRKTETVFTPNYDQNSFIYEKATFAEFSENPMYYVNLMIQISLIESAAGSMGGSAIDYTNILTKMDIYDVSNGSQKVTVGINGGELAGTSLISAFDLNFYMDQETGYLSRLEIDDVKLVGILNMGVYLDLDLTLNEGDPFVPRSQVEVSLINGSSYYFEGFIPEYWN